MSIPVAMTIIAMIEISIRIIRIRTIMEHVARPTARRRP